MSLLDQIKEPSPLSSDSKAKKEEKEFYRNEETKDLVHYLFKIGLRIAFGLGVIIFSIRVFHLVAPLNWHWLDQSQVSNLDKFLYSGFLGALLGKYTDKIFN